MYSTISSAIFLKTFGCYSNIFSAKLLKRMLASAELFMPGWGIILRTFYFVIMESKLISFLDAMKKITFSARIWHFCFIFIIPAVDAIRSIAGTAAKTTSGTVHSSYKIYAIFSSVCFGHSFSINTSMKDFSFPIKILSIFFINNLLIIS